MVLFIYKCYYVLFLHYSNYKREVPWIAAMFALAASLVCLSIFLIHLFGVSDTFNSFSAAETDSALIRKGKRLFLFVIPLCVLCWRAIYYVVFNLAEASKEDGLSDRYSFTPTTRDKVICWCALMLPLLLVTVPTVIKKLMGHEFN